MHVKLPSGQSRPVLSIAIVIAIAVTVLAVARSGIIAPAAASPSAVPSQVAAASASDAGSPAQPTLTVATAPATATPAATPIETPTAAPTIPPLPGLLAAIGDSYSQAYAVSPQYRYDHPEFSWVVGTSPSDGVISLLERFRGLGASPVVVDAATSGRKMNDASRQAALVVAAARKLSPGQTAYVTFELGTNDLCDVPMTGLAPFQQELSSALATLRTGLPAGSRILMLAVPDFPHFHAMTQADPKTRAALLIPRPSNCPPYLGTDPRTTFASSNDYLSKYDAILEAGCDGMDAGTGTPPIICTYDSTLLAESDFVSTDLGTYDYFHPSLAGQAKMAAAAWQADAWSSMPQP
jgi:lysophospholipase L1-like esterase